MGDLRSHEQAIIEIHEEVNEIEQRLEENNTQDKITSWSMSGAISLIGVIIMICQMKTIISMALDGIKNRTQQAAAIPVQTCQLQPMRSSAYTGY